jgi:uncharacterized protein (DUF1697 family)
MVEKPRRIWKHMPLNEGVYKIEDLRALVNGNDFELSIEHNWDHTDILLVYEDWESDAERRVRKAQEKEARKRAVRAKAYAEKRDTLREQRERTKYEELKRKFES